MRISVPATMPSRRPLLYAFTVISIAVLLTAGCEPPGKPKPEIAPAEITDFNTLFSENCSGCHGINGKNGAGRPLNDPLYLALIPKDALRNVIENGRKGTAMPAWARDRGGPLYPKQITALVDGIEQNWAKPVSLKGVAAPSYSAGNAEGDSANGKKLFARNCFMCHGKGAPIGSVTDPVVLALASDQYLRTSILFGRPDFGMPDFRHLKLGRALSDQDVTDLVAYLSSMRPPTALTAHTVENGTGQGGQITTGNQGSGHGPGSPTNKGKQGNRSASSEQGVK